jgi:endonuclease III
MKAVDTDFIEKFVSSWESRHDEWVRDFLANAIDSTRSTMSAIRPELRAKLEGDWRFSLAFLLDRTTYQSRRDALNYKTATYLFERVCSLPPRFSESTLHGLIVDIRQAKHSEKVTHIRENTDIRRLESIAEFLIDSREKNITKLILAKVHAGNDVFSFLKQFHFIGDKTASFYMKFICWLFDLSILPIVVDTHVMRSLIEIGEIVKANPSDAKNAILRISRNLNISPIRVETALYESSWQEKNLPTSSCT